MLTEKERLRLNSWNDTDADYPRGCIHNLFEAQAERTPDAVAIVFEDEQLTYRQLNAKANQLARYLQGLGVEPDMLVGLCIEGVACMTVALNRSINSISKSASLATVRLTTIQRAPVINGR